MVFPSSWISQSIQNQNSMFAGLQGFGQTTANGGQGFMNGGPPSNSAMGGVPPPPPPATLGAFAKGGGGYGGGPTAGAFSEAMAGRMVAGASGAMSLAGAGITGLGVLGSMGMMGGLGTTAAMANPMSAAMSAGMGAYGLMGGGMLGMAGGGLAAAGVGLPMYAGAAWAGGLAKNFMGGMQDQMSLNSNLRQNFNFMGGQGAFGRGFSQSQMGAIGGMVSGELRNNLFTSAQEMNSVIAGGAQMGSFTGVRDVQEFSKKFKEMLGTLKTVQKELGGSLTDALSFVSESRAAGVFSPAATARFAGTIRSVSASTGLQQGQLMQLSMQGAQISRSVGGRGEQGAVGALRSVNTVGAAMQTGVISEAMLSEATGGRTGQDAMTSFVTDMMQRTGAATRRAHGRYGIFGLANESGTGLDEAALMRFQSGDIGAGELSRMAHRNVGRMGRAAAVNREGLLRGAAVEQGGLSFQLGQMRQIVGDRAMDGGDDLMSLVMQRRLHMSRPQAEIMTSLMRNQGTIAVREAGDRVSSANEALLRTDIKEHRSIDAFTRHLEHAVADETGMLKAKDMGRSFVNRVSSLGEKIMNDMLGIASEQMSTAGQESASRMRQGRASREDVQRLFSTASTGSGMGSGMGTFSVDSSGMFETGSSVGARMRARGIDTRGMDRAEAEVAIRRMQDADAGILHTKTEMRALGALGIGTAQQGALDLRIIQARMTARGSGNGEDFFRVMGGNGNATAAALHQLGYENPDRADGMGRLAGRSGSGSLNLGMFLRDNSRLAAMGLGAVGAGIATLPAMGAGFGLAVGAFSDNFTGGYTGRGTVAAAGGSAMQSEVLNAMRNTSQENAMDFMAAGGHLAEQYEGIANSRGTSTNVLARVGMFAARNTAGGMISNLAGRFEADRQSNRATSTSPWGAAYSAVVAAGGFLEDAGIQLVGSGLTADEESRRDGMVTSREGVMAAFGDEGFHERMQAVAAATTPAARATAMADVSSYANRQSGSAAGNASMQSVVMQATLDIARHNQLGTEFSAVLSASPAEIAAAETAKRAMVNTRRRMATAVGEGTDVGKSFAAEAAAISAGDTAGYLQAQAVTAGLEDRMGDEEFSTHMQQITGAGLEGLTGAALDAAMAENRERGLATSQRHSEQANLRGEGRRGGRGAWETAMGMATGYGSGSMEFNVGGHDVSDADGENKRRVGGRHLGGRAAAAALEDAFAGRGGRRGKATRDGILGDYRRQLVEGNHYTTEMATQSQALMQAVADARDSHGGLTSEAGRTASANLTAFRDSKAVQAANTQTNRDRATASLSSASARDPVGAKQIELLGSINDQLKGKTVVPTDPQ